MGGLRCILLRRKDASTLCISSSALALTMLSRFVRVCVCAWVRKR
jgi:hypothetical protein